MDPRPFPFNYVHGKSTGGIFYYSYGRPYYIPLDAVDGDLNFHIGEHIIAIFCSTAGLLLCQRQGSYAIDRPIYAVLNPFIPGSERAIEIALHRHPLGTARALILDRRGQDACRYVFHIVCAVPGENDGGYTIEEYSSNTRQWHYRDMIPNGVGRIRASSGVSCGRRAYWLTETTGLIICYDVESQRHYHVNMPSNQLFQDQIVRNHSQLGVGDSSGVGQEELLILVAATHAQVVVYTLRPRHGIWTLDLRFSFASCQRPIPLRSQSRGLEVLLCYRQSLHNCVNAWGWGQNASIFSQLLPPLVLDSADNFMPHIVNLVLNPRNLH